MRATIKARIEYNLASSECQFGGTQPCAKRCNALRNALRTSDRRTCHIHVKYLIDMRQCDSMDAIIYEMETE